MIQSLTNPNKFVVVTYSGSHYFINTLQYDLVLANGTDEIYDFDGSKVKGRNIAEIVTIEQYQKDHPEKVKCDVDYLPTFTINQTIESFTPERRKRALESIKNGFEKITKGKQIGREGINLLKQMNMRIGTAEWERD